MHKVRKIFVGEGGDKNLVAEGTAFPSGVGGGGGGGGEESFSRWWGLRPSPPVGKILYVVTSNSMAYALFHYHKPLIMHHSNYHQK